MPVKLFIGNVQWNTKAEKLRVLFEEYGKVTECNVVKNYAFVYMENESEANQAILELDGCSVRNSKIRVQLSQEKKPEVPNKKFSNDLSTKIFIGNINSDIKADQIRVLFEQYGKVTECDIINNYAFVHMVYENEANQAIRELDGYSVGDSKIRVELSHSMNNDNADKKPSEKKSGKMPTKIFVGNVNPYMKAEQLRMLFEQYGKVTECDIINNYAFVHMVYENEANQAIRELDGYSVGDSKIRVELSQSKKNDNTDKKSSEKKSGTKRPLGNQGSTGNFNSRFSPEGFGGGNWSGGGGGGGGGFDQRLPFRNNYPDYYERDDRMPPLHDRYPSGPGPMSDRMGPQGPLSRDRMMSSHPDRYAPQDRYAPSQDRYAPSQDRYAPPQDRMRPSSPYDRRPPAPPHAQRDAYYMDRDPYYRERSPLSRPPPEYYDRNPKRDYPLSPYQNNDNMGGFKRDAPMGRDMGMRSMGMDAPLRDQMPLSRGGMDSMRRENMGGRGRDNYGRDNYGQGDLMDHYMGNRGTTTS